MPNKLEKQEKSILIGKIILYQDIDFVPPTGLEPAIDTLEVCCIIHYATEADCITSVKIQSKNHKTNPSHNYL